MTASGGASSSLSSGGSECANVFLVAKPAGETVGKLCTAIADSGTFTAASTCGDSVTGTPPKAAPDGFRRVQHPAGRVRAAGGGQG